MVNRYFFDFAFRAFSGLLPTLIYLVLPNYFGSDDASLIITTLSKALILSSFIRLGMDQYIIINLVKRPYPDKNKLGDKFVSAGYMIAIAISGFVVYKQL